MELKSEQQYQDITVTDIDAAYPGDLQTFCLREGDKFTDNDKAVIIEFKAGGSVTLWKRPAHWMAIRQRTLRVPVPQTGE